MLFRVDQPDWSPALSILRPPTLIVFPQSFSDVIGYTCVQGTVATFDNVKEPRLMW